MKNSRNKRPRIYREKKSPVYELVKIQKKNAEQYPYNSELDQSNNSEANKT